MVEANTTLVERKRVYRIGKLVQSDEGSASHEPDGASKGTGFIVYRQFGVEESLVPHDSAVEIADRQSDVGDGRDLGHGRLLHRSVVGGP